MNARLAASLVLIAAAVAPGCTTTDSGRDDGNSQKPSAVGRIEIRSRTDKGSVLYVLADDLLRSPGDGKAGDWYRDGLFIRRGGRDGKKAYWFSRGELRQTNADGPVLLTFRGNKVLRGATEEVLFVVRGGTVHRGDKEGTRVLWVDEQMPDWALAMALQGMY